MAKTDYQKTGKVELKKGVYTVMFLTENGNAILLNEDIYDLYFIEDIFKFSMSGKIVFNDRYNFLEVGPFTGQEKIALIYGIGEDARTMIFDIWKVGKISQSGSGIQETAENLIEINFVDPFFPSFFLRRYSRSWKDERYSSIITDILNNMCLVKDAGFPLNVEESSNRTDFIIPYWTPKTALSYLGKRAKGKVGDTSGYLFFNNTKNGITTNAVTLNYLLLDIDRTLDKKFYRHQSDIISDKNKILEWWINGIDRTSNAILRGGWWRGFDFKTKKLLQVGNTYSEFSKRNVMLGRKTLYPPIDDFYSSNMMEGDSDSEILYNVSFNDWAKRYNMQFILNIIVEGDDSRHAGQHIELEWPGIQGNDKMNEALVGKYLIKSVTHNFSSGGLYPYRQRLVCIKNAYHNITSELLHDSTITNLWSQKKDPSIIIRR